jgi:hypothetical protein
MKHPRAQESLLNSTNIRKRGEKFIAESLQCDDEKTFAGPECVLHRT